MRLATRILSSIPAVSGCEVFEQLVCRVARVLRRCNRHVQDIGLLPDIESQERAAALFTGDHRAHALDGLRCVAIIDIQTETCLPARRSRTASRGSKTMDFPTAEHKEAFIHEA
jgi:hypothetical protein